MLYHVFFHFRKFNIRKSYQVQWPLLMKYHICQWKLLFIARTGKVKLVFTGINFRISYYVASYVRNDALIICWERISSIPINVILMLARLAPFCLSAQATAGKKTWHRELGTAIQRELQSILSTVRTLIQSPYSYIRVSSISPKCFISSHIFWSIYFMNFPRFFCYLWKQTIIWAICVCSWPHSQPQT